MTIDEFLVKLKGIAPGYIWKSHYDVLRGHTIGWQDVVCPIVAVAQGRNRERWPLGLLTAYRQLELSDEDLRKLVVAADGQKGYDADLRTRMLEAVGL